MPARSLSSVLLPDPLRPTMPKNSPRSTTKLAWLTASNSSNVPLRNGCNARSLRVCICSWGRRNRFVTPCTTMAGSGIGVHDGSAPRRWPASGSGLPGCLVEPFVRPHLAPVRRVAGVPTFRDAAPPHPGGVRHVRPVVRLGDLEPLADEHAAEQARRHAPDPVRLVHRRRVERL